MAGVVPGGGRPAAAKSAARSDGAMGSTSGAEETAGSEEVRVAVDVAGGGVVTGAVGGGSEVRNADNARRAAADAFAVVPLATMASVSAAMNVPSGGWKASRTAVATASAAESRTAGWGRCVGISYDHR